MFSGAVQAAEAMIQEDHYASTEVKDRLKQLLEERDNLHVVWQRRKVINSSTFRQIFVNYQLT